MDDRIRSPRERLFRQAAVLQLKLVADGLRDAVLIPVSLVAAAVGLLRGGDDCDTEFRRVIDLGRRSERWINLFGHHRPIGDAPSGSMDAIIDQVEQTVRGRYEKGARRPAADSPGAAGNSGRASDTEPGPGKPGDEAQ